MLSSDNPTLAAEIDALRFAWTPDRFNDRVAGIPTVVRAGPPDTENISLAYGQPDPNLFPAEGLSEASADALRNFSEYAVALQYGPGNGNPVLLEHLSKKLEQEEGKPVEPGSLLITNGSSQAISLIVQVLANPGDVCLIEAPTFMGTIRTIQFNGVEAVPVPLDSQGANLEALEAAIKKLLAEGKRPRFFYTIPTFNNPAGITMPLERRQALLELAAKYSLPIIEDDAYGDLRYEGEPVPSLHALDTHGLVIRLGTFSKIVAPGVRLGFMLADPAVIQRAAPFKSEGSTNGLASLVVGTFMKSGGLAEHIKLLRNEYRTRRDVTYATLESEMPDAVTWTQTDGGFFLWLTLAPSIDMKKVMAKADEEKVKALPGTACFVDGSGTHNLRLAFSLNDPERQAEGIRRLARAIRAGM